MKDRYDFELVKAATNVGGDRYVTTVGKKPWTVYFPQELSRPAGRPVRDISIVVYTGGIDPGQEDE